jgi:serine protease Do
VVLADGGRRGARVRGRDRSRGLVLLAVEGLEAPPLEPVARATLQPGQWAIAVGRGWSAAEPSVAVGIVSATNRAWGKGMQTDAAVSPMNYGGPLVDIAGRVIGILAPLPADTAGMTTGTELYDAGIGFAVPLEDVLAVLPQLARGESLDPGILGIGYRSRDAINGEPVIASVQQGSPASRAGLQPGDRISGIDGRRVMRIADARHAIAPRRAGDTVTLRVERSTVAGQADGGNGEVGKPEMIETRATLVAALPAWQRALIGIVAAPTADDERAGPLRVGWVLPEGPAERAGVQAGDVIESIAVAAAAATPLDGRASAAGILAGVEPGERVTLAVRRGGAVTTSELVTTPLPGDVPAAGPPPPRTDDDPLARDPLAGPAEAVEVVRLAGADVALPAVAVIPRGTGPVGLVVWLGSPHGPVAESEAAAWKLAAARHDVAVILPGSGDPASWSRDDLPAVTRAIAALHGRRPIDPSRIGVAGAEAGAAFAWLVAERLGPAAGGVALVEAALPRQAEIKPAEPGAARWVLLGPGTDDEARARVARDRARLEQAGYPAGLLEPAPAGAPPADLLCRWVSLLGLL